LLSFIAKNILSDPNPVHELRDLRNKLAHGAANEFTTKSTDDYFSKLEALSGMGKWHGIGHGLPEVSLGPVVPYPSTPCG
jgi:hypothetical protein